MGKTIHLVKQPTSISDLIKEAETLQVGSMHGKHGKGRSCEGSRTQHYTQDLVLMYEKRHRILKEFSIRKLELEPGATV